LMITSNLLELKEMSLHSLQCTLVLGNSGTVCHH